MPDSCLWLIVAQLKFWKEMIEKTLTAPIVIAISVQTLVMRAARLPTDVDR